MSKLKPTIVVADDDDAIRFVVSEALKQEGWTVIEAEDVYELKRLVLEGRGDMVITDVIMPDGNGLDVLPEILTARPDMPVIVMSAQNTMKTAMTSSSRGAYDYLPKPFDIDALVTSVKKGLKTAFSSDQGGGSSLEDTGRLIGRSAAMQEIYRAMARVVQTELTVMITGESGTGKELVARAIHEHSQRRDHPFVAVNMAAIPKELIESELFGHERGAFTGAETRKLGRFGQAKGGTIFLDEIGDMPLEAQTRLLRVLQEGEYQTVGGHALIKTDVRIVAATNKDLRTLVRRGDFREDLFFRLNVVPLNIPPLRDRKDDIPLLADHFLLKATDSGLPKKTLTEGAKKTLMAFDWPGNVRELENMLLRVCALYAEEEITGDVIKQELDRSTSNLSGGPTSIMTPVSGANLSQTIRAHLDQYFDHHEDGLPPSGLYQRILREMERPLIQKVLEVTSGNQVKASDLLGLNRNTLRKKIRELGITDRNK
ncbi:nitrogen regulation protein NR(I) [Kordiimonas sediminis]|uniref:DNA-binding transcriptional regulator NtrC n=1 Tax=Kordiimonas sediminis TaxID=1735581 RepID=A0A919E9U5_9PROT|nr:nitrogen regulation protein NR(I) [Kordiimonas sediminis]GHF28230.1 nitrogen regulation protein NR(I) [Kordiimonas sediminis]